MRDSEYGILTTVTCSIAELPKSLEVPFGK
jgi:hypothetical protein